MYLSISTPWIGYLPHTINLLLVIGGIINTLLNVCMYATGKMVNLAVLTIDLENNASLIEDIKRGPNRYWYN